MVSLSDLENELILFTLKLYNNPVIPRNVVQTCIDSMFKLITESFFLHIKEQLRVKIPDERINRIFDDVLNSSKIVFDKFKTERSRFLLYEQKDLMIKPVAFPLGTFCKQKQVKSEVATIKTRRYAYYVPLKWSLKVLLEIPGSFDLLKNHMMEQQKEKKIISNFVQGTLYKKKCESCDNKFIIPIFIFQDDFEAGNAMGSHAGKNKLGGVYASLPGFPPNVTAHLSYILLTLLFYSKDRKERKNDKVFEKLIRELNELRHDGLEINVGNVTHKVYFQLFLILGDNLGVNEILGFVTTFASGKPCRICSASMDLIKVLTYEDTKLLRTKESYEIDCRIKDPKQTGITEECTFHQVDGYRLEDAKYMDLMHDIFEGTANDSMVNILDDLIYKQGVFDLHILNERMQNFDYGPVESSNAVPEIKKEHIKIKKKLKMSAAEMLCFTRYFGLFIGDKVDEKNKSWMLYKLLRKIVSIVTSPRLVQGCIVQLDHLISQFLTMYKEMYGELKYKFHNMTHLTTTLNTNGPLVFYWCMRYESKHRQLKLTAVTTSNRTNLLKTLCIRSQLQLAYLKFSKNLQPADNISLVNCDEIDQATKKKYFPSIPDNTQIFSTDYIEFNGIQYQEDMVLVVEMGDNDLLHFGKITEIFTFNEKVFLRFQPFSVIYFDDHYFAYKVIPREVSIIKEINDLPDIHPCVLVEMDESLFVATRYIL